MYLPIDISRTVYDTSELDELMVVSRILSATLGTRFIALFIPGDDVVGKWLS